MPKFYQRNILTKPVLDPTHELESPLDTPELPVGDEKQQEQKPLEDSDYQSFDDDYNPVKTLFSWKATSRPYRKKDRSFYTTVATLIILTSLIAVLGGQIILMGALFALGFVVYVLNFIPPEDVDYKISTQGVTIGDHFYHWQQLDSFWFSEKEGHKILSILTEFRFPAIVMMVIGDLDQEEVKRVVARFLPFHEIAPKTTIDKWAESLQKHFPLENPHK